MFRNGTTTALILSSVLATGCWTDDVAHGYLAVEFEDGEVLTRPIIIPPAEEGEYRLYYALESRDKVCVLRGRIPQQGFFLALFAKSVVKHDFPWLRPAIERVSDQGLIHGPSSETIPSSLRDSEWRRH